jgi:PAS domain S-box-containing protein
MFRPIPEAVLFRKIPHRLVASVLLLGALACTALLLMSLERENFLLVILISAISVAAVIMFSYYDSTKRTLEEVKSLARNILESIPTGVLTVNRNGVVTAVNPAAEAVLKRRAAELLGHYYESAFASGEIIRQVLDGALRSHRHMTEKDVPYEGINGRLQTIRVSTVELREDDGQPAGVFL